MPLGILLGHLHRFSFLAINVSNIGRALPSLGVLALFLPITGIGETTVLIALVVLAAPPILTNTYVAVDQVDADTVDAAKGIGLKPWQVITSVEIPPALPLIFAGIRTVDRVRHRHRDPGRLLRRRRARRHHLQRGVVPPERRHRRVPTY